MADKIIKTLNEISVGDFIKMVDRDKQGKFNYIGEVISVQKGKTSKVSSGSFESRPSKETYEMSAGFEMATFEGVIGFCMEDPSVHELYHTAKPKGWAKFKKDPVAFKGPPEPTEIKINEMKSKKELVLELVKNNSRKNEKSLLKLAKKEIGGSDTQLANYIKLALLAKK
jgi:hypothetical protein